MKINANSKVVRTFDRPPKDGLHFVFGYLTNVMLDEKTLWLVFNIMSESATTLIEALKRRNIR